MCSHSANLSSFALLDNFTQSKKTLVLLLVWISVLPSFSPKGGLVSNCIFSLLGTRLAFSNVSQQRKHSGRELLTSTASVRGFHELCFNYCLSLVTVQTNWKPCETFLKDFLLMNKNNKYIINKMCKVLI